MTITKYIKPEPLLIYVLLQDLSLSWLLHSAQWYITKLVFKKNHLTGFVINKNPPLTSAGRVVDITSSGSGFPTAIYSSGE